MPHRHSHLLSATEHLTFLCRVSAYVSVFISVCWLAVFVSFQEWEPVISLLLLAVAALPCWYLAVKGHFSGGLMLAQVICLVFITVFCFRYDVPAMPFQRTTHLYLPVIALVGYMNYQKSRSSLQMALIVLTLCAFALLCSPVQLTAYDYPVPLKFQMVSSWINPVVSTVLLFGGIAAMHADFYRNVGRVKALQHALYNEEFILYYQPMVNASGEIVGAEALLRWQHPLRGFLPPSEFLSDAQNAGLMPMIGEWVISRAFKDLTEWHKIPAMSHLSVSVNITADHFMQPDFVRKLIHRASVANVSSHHVKLELTESVFVSDQTTVAARMHELATKGFRFSLDDFGTGFSSLSYLRGLPLKQMKIDRSFVNEVTESVKDSVIAKNIARLGNELGLEVVAEGIETQEQWSIMKDYGCTVFQGFLFSRPVTSSSFQSLMTEGQ